MLRHFLPLLFRHQNTISLYHWTIGNYAQHRAVGEYLEVLPGLGDTLVEAWQGLEGPLQMPTSLPIGEVTVPQNPTELKLALENWIFVLEHIRQTAVGHLLDQPITDWLSHVARLRYLIDLD